MRYRDINSIEELTHELTENNNTIEYAVIRGVDFTYEDINRRWYFKNIIFLGCKIPTTDLDILYARNCLLFPELDVIFNPYRDSLYTPKELFDSYKLGDPDSYNSTLDKRVLDGYSREYNGSIVDSLATNLHDQGVTDLLYKYTDNYPSRKIIAVMGGHNLKRTEPDYPKIAHISKELTEQGYLMLSGGGPGAMEATHLGSWFAGRSSDELEDAIELLSTAPSYRDIDWLDSAFQVIEKYPEPKYRSVGIPTWFYGHEPPTPFATDIAKYFNNSIREDILLALPKGGIIFAPGDAGTIQEIFQETTQNHYLSYGESSPMIFFNREYWENKRPIYPLLKMMSDNGKYKNLILSMHSEKSGVIREIKKFTDKV